MRQNTESWQEMMGVQNQVKPGYLLGLVAVESSRVESSRVESSPVQSSFLWHSQVT